MVKLLIVDDEIDICDFVKKFFSERNFEVFVAYNGKEAIDVVKTKKPEIILLDVTMPIMDGIETLKNIREKDTAVKIIMVTAVDDEEKIEESKKYGAIDYITKPLVLDQLERSVLNLSKST